MKLPTLSQAHFISRDNRFRATVWLDGQGVSVHVPNSGRLKELLVPGRPVWVAPAQAEGRKTHFDLQLVEMESGLVAVDARLPNKLFAEAVKSGRLPDFAYPAIVPEVRTGHSRLDFRLEGPQGVCWVETKSVTLVREGEARFPDAPTGRGTRHLETLITLRREGYPGAIVFVIQRLDAKCFAPNRATDPLFADTLARAMAAGVEVMALRCRVSLDEIAIQENVPVAL